MCRLAANTLPHYLRLNTAWAMHRNISYQPRIYSIDFCNRFFLLVDCWTPVLANIWLDTVHKTGICDTLSTYITYVSIACIKRLYNLSYTSFNPLHRPGRKAKATNILYMHCNMYLNTCWQITSLSLGSKICKYFVLPFGFKRLTYLYWLFLKSRVQHIGYTSCKTVRQ